MLYGSKLDEFTGNKKRRTAYKQKKIKNKKKSV